MMDSSANEVSNENALSAVSAPCVLVAKWGKKRIVLDNMTTHDTISAVKDRLTRETGVLQKRQKLIGLMAVKGGSKAVNDDTILGDLKVKAARKSANSENDNCSIVHEFILMGTAEAEIFVDPSEKDDLPDVIDDFELDFNVRVDERNVDWGVHCTVRHKNRFYFLFCIGTFSYFTTPLFCCFEQAGSHEWLNHVANGENLKKFTEHTEVHLINPPREGKPLMVLDLDHTLLDFSRRALEMDSTHQVGQGSAALMKRPYMDEFLVEAYKNYDLVVWSQTSWRWLETKLIELGMITNPAYKFCFVLDKTSM
jgi:ubiquitin-like domain-containing CTD phosphatase 1